MSTNLDLQPQSSDVQALLLQATKLLQASSVEDAFNVTLSAKALRTPLINLDLVRAACFINMHRPQEALESLREELHLFPGNIDAQRLFDQLSQEIGDTGAASTIDDPDFNQLLKVIRPYTMLSTERLYRLFSHARRICLENIPGNFVECGVAAGGSSALLAYVIRRYSRSPRFVWCFDSFSGMPPAGAHDKHDGTPADLTGWGTGTCAAPLASLERLADTLGVRDLLRPIEGLFESTLAPSKNWVGMISLLHLNAEWYSSTKTPLETFYDRVVDRGLIQIDDFGYWEGCRKACEEFFITRQINPIMTSIDDTGVWFEKPGRFPINAEISPRIAEEFARHDVALLGIESQMSENERFQLFWLLSSQLQCQAAQGEVLFTEVGSYAGASLLQSCIALRTHGLPISAIAVEPTGQSQFYQVLRELGNDARHLKMNSEIAAPIIAQEYKRAGRLADAIFIDGDHSYQGVKQDLSLYFPLVKSGGLLIVHDYLPALTPENRELILSHHANNEPGIRQACDEFFTNNAQAQALELPLLKPSDPTQTQSYLPIIPGVFSTVRAWRKI